MEPSPLHDFGRDADLAVADPALVNTFDPDRPARTDYHGYDEVLAEAEQALDDVDHALRRLDEGTYGTCELCGGPIEERRLVVLPAARSCEEHPQLTDQFGVG